MAGTTPKEHKQLQTYHGSCHCGAFRYSAKLPSIEKATACNCSVCSKKGYLWAFPASENFVVEKGDGTLRIYEFGNKSMGHKFCPICGTAVMGLRYTNPPAIGLNLRAIRDLDLESLKINTYEGSKLDPAYQAPEGPKPSNVDTTLQTYNGSCHCGKVIYVLQSKPLEELEVTECNCAICSRNADLWLYPKPDAVTVEGSDHLTLYSRYHKNEDEKAGHGFCSTCGVPVLNQLSGSMSSDFTGPQPINVRTINDLDVGNLRRKKVDGKNWGQPYVLDAKEQ